VSGVLGKLQSQLELLLLAVEGGLGAVHDDRAVEVASQFVLVGVEDELVLKSAKQLQVTIRLLTT
jgi:molybdopterin-biosynthesis enzyme MoeA-like protein